MTPSQRQDKALKVHREIAKISAEVLTKLSRLRELVKQRRILGAADFVHSSKDPGLTAFLSMLSSSCSADLALLESFMEMNLTTFKMSLDVTRPDRWRIMMDLSVPQTEVGLMPLGVVSESGGPAIRPQPSRFLGFLHDTNV